MTHRQHPPKTRLTYKDAGVDIDSGQKILAPIKALAKKSERPEILSGVGGFAALCELPQGYRKPVLVTATDGVGTKLQLANAQNLHQGLGQDLVAMSVNDVLVTGAEPLLFLDYIAISQLDPLVVIAIVEGVSQACVLAGCTLAGGETAEMPGLYQPGDYDLAGFCVGVVEKDSIIDGRDIVAGDLLLGLPSSGPHANGFSLIRMILERRQINLSDHPELTEQLLAPTEIYSRVIRQLAEHLNLLGMAHITGGGLVENLPRMLSNNCLAVTVSLDKWSIPPIFSWLKEQGNISDEEMLKTFNCGIGMVVCIHPEDLGKATEILTQMQITPSVIGQIDQGLEKRITFNGHWG